MHPQLSFCILLFERIDTGNHQCGDQTDDDRNLAVCRRTLAGGGKTEVMAECRAGKKTEDGHSAVAAAFAGENQLAQRAAAEQHAGKACEHHAQEVPQTVRVRHGLIGKAEMEVAGAGR